MTGRKTSPTSRRSRPPFARVREIFSPQRCLMSPMKLLIGRVNDVSSSGIEDTGRFSTAGLEGGARDKPSCFRGSPFSSRFPSENVFPIYSSAESSRRYLLLNKSCVNIDTRAHVERTWCVNLTALIYTKSHIFGAHTHIYGANAKFSREIRLKKARS